MAAATTAATTVPLFDLFIDLPHPASDSSKTHAPPVVLPPPRPSATADELKSGNGIARIARFAFPEHDDRAYAGELQRQKAVEQASGTCGAGLNRQDIYMQNFAISNHLTFAMQLSNGTQVYGHVRRYLPSRPDAKSRHDVGRRGPRAVLIVTRYAGGDSFFASALKTVDALLCMSKATLSSPEGPVRDFMYGLYNQHAKSCASFAATSTSTSSRGRSPVFCSLTGLEFGANAPTASSVDTTRMIVPHVLLRHHPGYSAYASPSSAILPLVRCLGVPLSLRLLSALLLERRIILLSNSASRLSTVGRGALSLLAQGMIEWPHAYVPILPPGLLKVVVAPNPYLLGILSRHAANLSAAPGLGEVFVIDLDAKTYQMYNCQNRETAVPDLLRPAFLVGDTNVGTNLANQSPADILSKDLEEILKADRRFMVMKTASAERIGNAQEQIHKGKTKVINAFGKLKKRIGNKESSMEDDDVYEGQTQGETPAENLSADSFGNDSYEYSEGFPNESCEAECRVAFAIFFLTLLGDMKCYLAPPTERGGTPTLDVNKFIASRRSAGDIEGTPMFPLIQTFARGKLLEKFAHDRVEEVKRKEPVRPDAPLFLLTANHCRVKRIDFTMMNVRGVVKQLKEDSSPESRYLIRKTDDIRRCGASLTSSKGHDGNPRSALSQMVEDAHETSRVLVDVMSVIWTRLADCTGMMWKHGLLGLQVLKQVLLEGPLAAICEATDNIEKIRAFKSYSATGRSSHRAEVQAAATEIYVLLVDRARLFRLRREIAEMRRKIKAGRSRTVNRRAPVRLNMGFKNLHTALKPASVSPLSAGRAPQMHMTAATTNLLNKSLAPNAMTGAAAAVPAPSTYANDLLSLGFAAPAAPAPAVPPPAAPVAPVPVAPPPAVPLASAPSAPPAFSMPPAPAAPPSAAPVPAPAGDPFNMFGLSQATPTTPVPAPAPVPSTTQYGFASNAPAAIQPQAPPAPAAQPQMAYGAASYPTMTQQQVPSPIAQPPVQQYPGYPPAAATATQGFPPQPAAAAYAQQPQTQQFGYQQPSPSNAPPKQQRNAFSQFDPFG